MNATKQPGFSNQWLPVKSKFEKTITKDGYFKYRSWQKEFRKIIKGESRRICNAPMGSGKSFACTGSAVEDLKQDSSLKAIIAVPQTIIGASWRDNKIEFPDGSREDVIIPNQNDLLSVEGLIADESMVNRMIDFLEKPTYDFLPSRILLCSHQSLVKLFQRLERTNRLHLLENISFYIDEAHHIKIAEYEIQEEYSLYEQNEIGKLIYVLHRMKNVIITLITATFFRGDKLSIIPKEIRGAFCKFDLPYDEYFKSLEHLRSFSFDFILYTSCPTEAINLLFKERIGKTIIYIPHVMSKYSTGNKRAEVKKIIEKIKHPRSRIRTENGITYVKRNSKEIAIVDLVDDSPARINRKNHIEKHAKLPSGPDVIIALGMFKEGANYDYADRSIIIGPRNSLTEMIQMIGRLFRDALGKEHVQIFQLLPKTFETQKEEFKDQLNDYLKAILGSMLLENVLAPHLAIGQIACRNQNRNATRSRRENAFNALALDDQDRLDILDEIMKRAIINRVDNGQEQEREAFDSIVKDVLSEYGITEGDHALVVHDIWVMLCRRTAKVLDGIDVSLVDIDLIKKGDPLGWLLKYTLDMCGLKTFKDVREAFNIKKEYMAFGEARDIMHKMRENGQPINTAREYRIFVENDGDYEAVLALRKTYEWNTS